MDHRASDIVTYGLSNWIERVISTIKPKLPDYVAKGMAAVKTAIDNREMLRCGRTPQWSEVGRELSKCSD